MQFVINQIFVSISEEHVPSLNDIRIPYALTYMSCSIYIYKEECLSVCLFAIRFHTVQPILMKLSKNDLLIQGEVDVYFV